VINYDPQLFAQVAAVNPGLVSTLNALVGQLKTGPLPSAGVLQAYGRYVQRLGDAVVSYAEDLSAAPRIEQADAQ
jgi:hypothetical protein